MIEIAYVFGLDLPVFELLFIVLILLIIGLFIIFLELKKLRDMLREEKKGIDRFEQDLNHYEQTHGLGQNNQMINFIKGELSRGVNKVQIRQSLVSSGWDHNSIEELFKRI